jgi:hypothetical protein
MKSQTFVIGILAASALAACSAGQSQPAESSTGGAPGVASGAGGVASGAGGDSPIFQSSGGTDGVLGGLGGGNVPRSDCATAAFKGDLLPASLLFLVDRSGSMNCNLPPTTNSADCENKPVAVDPAQPTKWSVIKSAMGSAFDSLGSLPNTSVGLTFFSTDDVCGATSTPNVALQLLSTTQVDALKGALANVTPRGGTPIVGTTILGYKHLHQEAKAPGNRFVVLVTDGADSCFDKYAASGVTGDVVARLLDTEIPKAISVNIKTFVIGAPGSEPARGLLSKIAFKGGTAATANCDHDSADPQAGTACHFDMTQTKDFAKDLSDALTRITGQTAMTCEFAVPQTNQDGTPVDKTSINVDYYKAGSTTDKDELYRDDTKPCDSGADGWQYTSPDETQIRLCGTVCDQVRADTKAQVVVSVGCAPRVR